MICSSENRFFKSILLLETDFTKLPVALITRSTSYLPFNCFWGAIAAFASNVGLPPTRSNQGVPKNHESDAASSVEMYPLLHLPLKELSSIQTFAKLIASSVNLCVLIKNEWFVSA